MLPRRRRNTEQVQLADLVGRSIHDIEFVVALCFPRFWLRASPAGLKTGEFKDNAVSRGAAASASKWLSETNVANSTTGSEVIRMATHVARSNIQAGSSSQRSLAAISREQRGKILPAFSTASCTCTTQPAQGCQR